MVAPFANKQVLGAQIGTKDDASTRKFKDITLSEFFGVKAGVGRSSTKSSKPRASATQYPEILQIEYRSVESPVRSLPRELKYVDINEPFPLLDRALAAPYPQVSSTELHSTGAGANESFYYLACGFVAAILVASSLEKALSKKRL